MSDSTGQFNIGNALTGMAQNGMAIQQGYADLRNKNLLYQQAMAQKAAGADFQKAIDPSTGQFSPFKYNQLLAADPNAAFAAQDASQAGMTNQTSQLNNMQQQINNKAAQLGYLADTFTGYAQNPPSQKQYISDLATGMSQGLYDSSQAASLASMYPDDPQQQKAFFTAEAQHLSAEHGAISRFLPAPQTVDTGSGAQIVDANPLSNPGIVGTQVQYGLTPQEQVTTGSVALPGGGTQVGTVPQLANVVGAPIPQGAVIPGGEGGAGTPLPSVNLGQGRITPAGPQAAAGGSATGLNIPAGTATIANNDADYFTSALGNQQAAAATLPALRNVLAATPGAQTGPAAADVASIGSTLNEFGINIGADQATQEQNLTKNGVQLVAALSSKLGTPTDYKMMEAALGSPNATLTEGAIRTIGAEMSGTAALANATANTLQQSRSMGIQPGTAQFAQLRSSLNNPMLGTAFQFAYLDPSARARVVTALGGVKSPQAQQLVDALNFAYKIEPDLPPLRGQ